jgi:hypothetical protein
MIRFLADEDFNGRIVRGLFRRHPDLDLLRVQQMVLSGADDEKILSWTADHDRMLLTHDARTMPRYIHERLAVGLHIPGVFIVDDLAPIGRCIADVVLIIECSEQLEWQDRIVYLPFAS